MHEILRLTHNDGDKGLVLVATPEIGVARLEEGAALQALAHHAGRDSRGCEVYSLSPTTDETYVTVVKGDVECLEGAVVAASEPIERNNQANLVVLGAHAVIELRGLAAKKGYVLYTHGRRQECGTTPAVLLALGVVKTEGGEPRPTPRPPAASESFLTALRSTGHQVAD